tara:strand:- start:76 stop:189 length:114 start_codon:yes stop_codon:yes gene_type:complete
VLYLKRGGAWNEYSFIANSEKYEQVIKKETKTKKKKK